MADTAHVHADLQARHRAEAEFHDHKYATGESFPRHYRVNPTYPVFLRMLDQLGDDLTGMRILEYGCGTGWITVELARRGAQVSAFDISPEAVAQTKALLTSRGLIEQCSVRVMGGEQLDYPDASFDAAVGFAILHHLEMTSTLAELRRVLKPGGRALFAEPLATNPAIRLYRKLTPQFRTVDETPIDLKSFRSQVGAFSRFTHHDQLVLATGAIALAYIPGMTAVARMAQRWLMRVDEALLKIVPMAGRFAWYSILVLQK